MRNPAFLTAALAASAFTLAAPAQAATTLSVAKGDGCGKTTCFNEAGTFSQSFSAKDFSGPVTISQLLLDRGVLGAMDGKTFQLSFTLNGETLTWGQYTMAGIGGDWLTFGGEGFVWNPEDGDLQLVLSILPPPKPGAGGGFFARSSAPASEGGPSPSDPFATGPQSDEIGPSAAVPEPASWALMIGGFGLAGAGVRQRRRLGAAQAT